MSSFGEELKRERELREIELREVAEATKINLRYLEAIERNEFGDLPGGLFNRGFVRAYAQFIGIDPEAMVNAYLLEEQNQSRDAAASGDGVLRGRRGNHAEATEQPTDNEASSGRGWVWGLPVLLGLIVLLILWLAGIFSGGATGG